MTGWYACGTVSYTHLDVYKRQILARALAKRPADRFPDVGAFAAAFRAAIAAGPAVGEAAAPLLDVANPYKGLLAFGEADAALFFRCV